MVGDHGFMDIGLGYISFVTRMLPMLFLSLDLGCVVGARKGLYIADKASRL